MISITNDLITEIAKKIKNEFGNDYHIYIEEIKQGIKTPCFFIKNLEPSTRQALGNRVYRINPFSIQFFPEDYNKNQTLNDISDRLFDILEYITFNGRTVRGTDMKSEREGGVLISRVNSQYESVDGVLSFHVSYNFHTCKENDKHFMQKLYIK